MSPTAIAKAVNTTTARRAAQSIPAGARVVDFATGFRGTVIAVDGDRVTVRSLTGLELIAHPRTLEVISTDGRPRGNGRLPLDANDPN